MKHIFFYVWECENIPIFSRRFEATFLEILYFREGKLRPKYSHPPWESNIPMRREYLLKWKDQNISVTTQSHLPSIIAGHPPPPPAGYELSPSAGHPQQAIVRLLPTSIKDIFRNLSNISENLIYPGMKIQFIYQMPPSI